MLGIFEIGSSDCLPERASILLISAFCVARIAGVSHRHLQHLTRVNYAAQIGGLAILTILGTKGFSVFVLLILVR
jgi:hypothetical protein